MKKYVLLRTETINIKIKDIETFKLRTEVIRSSDDIKELKPLMEDKNYSIIENGQFDIWV